MGDIPIVKIKEKVDAGIILVGVHGFSVSLYLKDKLRHAKAVNTNIRKSTQNTMKIFIIIISALLLASPVFSAEVDWSEPAALYRLTATVAKPEMISFLPLGDFLVPGGWGNGVRVYNRANEKIDFYLSPKDSLLFIPPGIENGLITVYFGYPSKQIPPPWPESKFGKVGEIRGLEASMVSAHTNSMPVKEREKLIDDRRRKLTELHNKIISEQREKLIKTTESLIRYAGSGIMAFETQLKAEEEKTNRVCLNKEKALLDLIDKGKKEKEERQRGIEKFFEKNPTLLGKRKVNNVFLDSNPFGEGYLDRNPFAERESNIAMRIKGLLVVPSDANYTFAINSVNNTLLKIDDKYVIGWGDVHEKTDQWEMTGTIALSAGLHEFQLFYQQNDGEIFASAAWKMNEQDDFKILTASDFAPSGIEAEVSPFRDQNGVEYPVISYNPVALVSFDKINLLWEKFSSRASPGGNENILWCINDTTVAKGPSLDMMLDDKENPKITVKSDCGRFPEYPLVLPRPFKGSEVYEPSIFVRFRDPSFIFDDETLEMSLEAYSELPENIGLILKTSASKVNGVFINGIETLNLRKKGQAEKSKFTTPHVLKKSFKLNGAELKEGLDVSFNLNLPPLNFEKVSFRFMPVQECRNLRETQNGIMDSENRKIIPVLHRPDLAEIRSWALLDYAMDKILPIKKVLIISEDFGKNENSFHKKIAAEFSKRGALTEFLPWRRDSDGQPLRESFVSFVEKIKNSDADRAVIIPPSVDMWKGNTLRLEERVIAATLILLNENKNFRTVNLCTPFPSVFSNSTEKGTVSSIKKSIRDFGTELIDLNSFIRKKEGWRKTYYENPDDSSMIEYYPVGMTGDIAEFISANLK